MIMALKHAVIFLCCLTCPSWVFSGKVIFKENGSKDLSYAQESSTWPTPPSWRNRTLTARYIAHYADWGVLSGISERDHVTPFGVLQSFADGPLNKSTGRPFFYISDMSTVYRMVKNNNAFSLTLSEAESNLCTKQGMDPELPTCAQITLSGKMEPVDPKDVMFAQTSLFARHPQMKDWPVGHNWKIYELMVNSVWIIDYFGGAVILPAEDYYKIKFP
ncbi:protein CREG1-like [Lingula anatina]|uniref:Protein CREG1-like n=1 Tax=Lingula anatina TaxID=7574 RepID=A0A1S3JV26_LINAN|nr:protein CREG1-like [Lingula anatina]XP_013414185.2 protein CREG1-like [Lingula anatina]XP_023932866.1 protein CREG1-like [Lingula anatina]|eukprot:XP_013414183.2 protein CREG1-like [Lingula anatina]